MQQQPISDKVAANLILAHASKEFRMRITDINNQSDLFQTDIVSKNPQSRSDWRWLKQAEFFFKDRKILQLEIGVKLIDLPFSGDGINIYSFFKSVEAELNKALSYGYK